MNDPNPVERLAVAREIVEIVPLVMRTLAAELRRSGQILMPAHIATLGMLDVSELNLSELAERLVVSRPTASNLISNLQERGWVQRVKSARDRRVVLIKLTPAGSDMLAAIMAEAEATVAAHLARLSRDDHDKLHAGLAVLHAIFHNVHEKTGRNQP